MATSFVVPANCLTRIAAALLGLGAGMACAAESANVTAERILAMAEARTGLILHLGCGDGELTWQLARGGRNVVLGLSADSAEVETARQKLRAKGTYGTVSVDRFSPSRLPLADSLANVIVAENFASLEKAGLGVGEVLRVLAPYGVAYLKGAKAPEGVASSQDGEWLKIIKPYPEAMDEWTQYAHDISGMLLSDDQVVGPPEGVRWITGGYWNGSMSDPVEIVSANGRVFYANMTASSGRPDKGIRSVAAYLEARDAFNGLTLWRRQIMPAAFRAMRTKLIAVGDKVYAPVAESAECLGELDAATGKLLRTYKFSGSDVRYVNGVFLVDHGRQAWSAATGEMLWEAKVDTPQRRDSTMIMARNEYVADGTTIVYQGASSLLGFTLDKGEKRWESPLAGKTELLLYCGFGRVLTEEQGAAATSPYAPVPFIVRAYDASDGRCLWKYELSHSLDKSRIRVFQVNADEVWCHTLRTVEGQPRPVPMFVCLDARTGKETKSFPTAISNLRCHPHRATSQYIFGPDGAMFSMSDGKTLAPTDGRGSQSALRGTCQFGYIPANGLLYQDLNKCLCYNSLRGSAAFAPVSAAPAEQGESRLEKGRAYSESPVEGADGAAWPMYRHDIARSGFASAAASDSPTLSWTGALSGNCSGPVIAAGKVFVAIPDQHSVQALDAADGKSVWSFTAGARVDSPPTYVRGRLLFGSSDGWVYCLGAADGQLMWRFRAAPADHRIMVRGQIESSWPVHGTVLVQGDTAYISAGRHTATDGGIFLYALDIRTGAMVWQNNVGKETNAFNDVLLADGDELYLDQLDLEKATGKLLKKSADEHVQTNAIWGGALGLLNEEVLEPPYAGQSGGRKQWRYRGYEAHLLAIDKGRVFGAVYEATAYGQEHTWRFSYRGWGKGEEGKLTLKGNKVFGVTPAGQWSQDFPADAKFRVKAVIGAGDKLVVAVAPDNADSSKGEIWMYQTTDGKLLSRTALPAAPAFDGVAAVDGAIYIATERASILRLNAK